MTQEEIIEKALSDQRNCRSNNMQKFFKIKRNQAYYEVIRFEGELYFVTLGWRTRTGDNGFAGTRVIEVASQGNKATTGYPGWQKGNDYEIVTDWFWDKYFNEDGMIAHYEIWHKSYPRQTKHAEMHTA